MTYRFFLPPFTYSVCLLVVTHMHGDHIFGLPGLILRLHMLPPLPNRKIRVLQIFGPVGLFNYIASTLSLSATELTHIRVEVFELHSSSRPLRHPAGNRTYPEFRHRRLVRRTIKQNPDQSWTLETATEVDSRDEAISSTNSVISVNIRAAEVEHTAKVQCFGYVVEEPQNQPRRIDRDKAIALGVQPGIKYKQLKFGFPVMSDDNLREVKPEHVLTGEARRARKFVLLGDCRHVPQPMARLCDNADVLAHEATLAEHDTGRRVENGGHSTAASAGHFAASVNAHVLALNHLPPTVMNNSSVNRVAREANNAMNSKRQNKREATAQHYTRVQVACDLMEILVPRHGFGFVEEARGSTNAGR